MSVVVQVGQSDFAANKEDVLHFSVIVCTFCFIEVTVLVLVRCSLRVSGTVCLMFLVSTSLTVSTCVSVEVTCSVVVTVTVSVAEAVTVEGG